MITPSGQIIVIPAAQQQTADSLWIQSLTIMAPNPTKPISAQMRIAPFNSQDGTIYPNLSKSVNIQDITGAMVEYPSIGIAMSGLMQAAQDVISGEGLF